MPTSHTQQHVWAFVQFDTCAQLVAQPNRGWAAGCAMPMSTDDNIMYTVFMIDNFSFLEWC